MVDSLLSSKPGINEANKPGKHKVNSSEFILNKLSFTISPKNLFLFCKEA